LAERPGGRTLPDFGPEKWLDGAIANVRAQVGYSKFQWDIYVGVDPEALVPLHVFDHAHVVRGKRPGQAFAVNAAVEVAKKDTDVLLFLEDDDRWHRSKYKLQVPFLHDTPFVSCSQRQVGEDLEPKGRCDYATPSSWLMEKDVWERVGPLDEGTRWLVDTEWLGRLNKAGVRRVHLVEEDLVETPNHVAQIASYSEVVPCGKTLLVDRTINTLGGMAKMASELEAGCEADEEASNIRRRFGCNPW
jgi:glycosyltransferase involved in cell wall biosynthesis